MSFMRSRYWLGLAVALGTFTAHAQLDVTVTSGNREPISAAFVPFGWQGTGTAAPFDVAALVEQDLENSGYFAGIERRNMISRPTLGVSRPNWARNCRPSPPRDLGGGISVGGGPIGSAGMPSGSRISTPSGG